METHHIRASGLGTRLAIALASLLPLAAWAASDTTREYEVKAAYLVKLHGFVKNPETSTRPAGTLVIGILGQDPFGESFTPVEGKRIGEDVLTIRRYDRFTEDLDLPACHVLFIANSEQTNLERILADLGNAPVLTVSDAEGFVETGGMIGLVLKDNRVRWEINRDTLEDAGLAASAQLLRNAVRVVGHASRDSTRKKGSSP